MKRIILSTVITGFLFTACQKEDAGAPTASNTSAKGSSPVVMAISPVPTVFTKKILAEEFVGTNIGATPEASFDLAAVAKSYPNNVYSASLHVDDVMASNATSQALKTLTTQPLSFPVGMINRKPFNGNLFIDSKQFNNAVQMLLNKPVDCGLAISTNIVGRSARIEVHAGFTATLTSSLEVHSYLIEDGIISNNPDFEQANSLNTTPGNMFYGAGNPIAGFEHKNVARRLLSANTINGVNMVPGGKEVFTNWIDLPTMLSGNSTYKILSFIIDTNTQEVLNVQECVLGQEKDWN